MGADVSEAEEASDEVMAAIASGGTYSFVPEPDEDEAVLPGEVDMLTDLLAAEPDGPSVQAGTDEVLDDEAEAGQAPGRSRARKPATRAAGDDEEGWRRGGGSRGGRAVRPTPRGDR